VRPLHLTASMRCARISGAGERHDARQGRHKAGFGSATEERINLVRWTPLQLDEADAKALAEILKRMESESVGRRCMADLLS
jgi:hypothetical protein